MISKWTTRRGARRQLVALSGLALAASACSAGLGEPTELANVSTTELVTTVLHSDDPITSTTLPPTTASTSIVPPSSSTTATPTTAAPTTQSTTTQPPTAACLAADAPIPGTTYRVDLSLIHI